MCKVSLEVLYNHNGSEVSSHWGANIVSIHLSHFFFFSPYYQSALRLEQEIKLHVKSNALFVIGVKRSSGTPIFAVLRFPSSYNDICNI